MSALVLDLNNYTQSGDNEEGEYCQYWAEIAPESF
jgi:hypothetical protein